MKYRRVSNLEATLMVFILPILLFKNRRKNIKKVNFESNNEMKNAESTMEVDLLKYLKDNEEKIYYTISKKQFRYKIGENGLYISRVKNNKKETFTFNNLKKALNQMPVDCPSKLYGVRGTSYCYAILCDFLRLKMHS